MSIIEKALQKQRSAGDAGARREPPRLERSADAAPHAPAVAAVQVPPATAARAPRAAAVHANLEELRAGGLLPPLPFADAITEQIRRIKWPLLESAFGRGADGDGRRANTLMITSAIAGEGKTFISFNLAMSMARERDYDLLLVDADVAKRDLSTRLHAQPHPGLIDAILDPQLDPESLVLDTGIAGLSFLPAGQPTAIASELFGSRRLAQIVGLLANADEHRVVLFDCSPLLATNETRILATLVDQVVMVVGAESTPQPLVLEAIGLLDRSKRIRCLLNQARVSHLSEHYYYGAYGSGYPAHEPPK
ncbi:MAG: AAA family ATPase [Proteobacteria bacterium]|nr:AAA family ATPase [Pseudomonadota bacterium]